MKRQLWSLRFVALASSVLVPVAAFAQSGFAGAVRDTTGAVLPGVTVEASSPALIEKVRTAFTDDAGLYSIVDLRPGIYTVTFTLPGFATVQREGIELPASFTATVNVEMRVGGVEETIVVSGQSPLVDARSSTKITVLSDEVLNALPTVRMPQSYVQYLPGVTGTILGAQHTTTLSLAIHGGRVGEYNTAIDGSVTRLSRGAGGGNNTFYGMAAIIEDLSIELGGLSAEHQVGGIFANIVPKEGSNRFSGFMYASYTGKSLQGDNVTDELRSRGVLFVPGIKELWDVNPAFGGRILRDRLWFYSAFGRRVNAQYYAGEFYNKTPLAWTYTPDLSRPTINKNLDNEANTRLTWQVTPRNKVAAYLSLQPRYVFQRNLPRGPGGVPVSPEATTYSPYYPNSFAQVIWKSPVSSRLLLEAAVSRHAADQDDRLQFDPPAAPDAWAALELSTNRRFRAVLPGATNSGALGHHDYYTYTGRTSASYVTGSHAFKVGLDLVRGSLNEWGLWTTSDTLVTLLNGVPRSLTLTAYPLDNEQNLNADLGVFAQDRWTFNRLTLSPGVRYAYYNSSIPAQHLAAGRWAPVREYAAVSDVPNWKDISPRFGVSYDLFGDGRTALKGFVGRYVAGQGLADTTQLNNPVITSVTSVTRTWTDSNGDYIPACDLRDPAANGECGRSSDVTFGTPNSRASRYDNALLNGWRKRGYNWEASAALQRQLRSGVSMDVGYYRRWYGNFTVTDNLAVTPSNYDPFCITAPVDPRLSGGGGQEICGLYDINPAKFGLVENLVTLAKPYGTQREAYNGVDLTMNARFGNGGQLSGGLSSGRTTTNSCFVIDSPAALRFCDTTTPFLTQVKFIGSFPLPWGGLQASGVFQSFPGPEIRADYVAGNAEIRPSLGRNLSSGANGTALVSLIQPGTVYASRTNQIDLRLSKVFQIGQARIHGNLDLFNLLNSSGIQFLNFRYGPTWQQPQGLQFARYVQFSAQLQF